MNTPNPLPRGTLSRGALTVVFMTVFLDIIGFGIVIPVLPFYAKTFGATPKVVALLSTAYAASLFVMAPILGRLSDRVGRRPVMLVSIAGSLASFLVLANAHSLWMLFVARIVTGGSGANISTAQAIVADRVPPQERARYMGMMGAAIGLGFMAGPGIGGLLTSPEHPERPFLVAAGFSALNWVLAWWLLPESFPQSAATRTRAPSGGLRERAIATWRLLTSVPMGILIVTYFGFNGAFSAMESTFPLLLEARLQWDATETGILFMGLGVVIVVMQGLVIGRLVARLGEARVLLLGLAVLACGFTTVGTAATVAFAVLGSAGIATGNALVSPSLSALVSRASPAGQQGTNLGIAMSSASLARVVSPVLAGLLFELVGPGVPMLVGAASVVVLAVIVAVRLPRTIGSDPTGERMPESS